MYIHARMLSPYKSIKSDNSKKDGRYNMVYVTSINAILSSRHNILGRICSDWLEYKYKEFEQTRIDGQKFIEQSRQ